MARVEMIMSHHHDKEDMDLARRQTYKWLFLSQGRLRNPRKPKGEKQLHVKFQTLMVESSLAVEASGEKTKLPSAF